MNAPAEYKLLAKYQAIVDASKDKALSRADLATFIALVERSDATGACYPGYGYISKQANVSRRAAIRSVERLIEHGYLAKDQSRRTGTRDSNQYLVLFGSTPSANPVTGDNSGTSANAVTTAKPELVTENAPKQCQSRHQPGANAVTTLVPNLAPDSAFRSCSLIPLKEPALRAQEPRRVVPFDWAEVKASAPDQSKPRSEPGTDHRANYLAAKASGDQKLMRAIEKDHFRAVADLVEPEPAIDESTKALHH